MKFKKILKSSPLLLGLSALMTSVIQLPTNSQTYVPVPVYDYYVSIAFSAPENTFGYSWGGVSLQESKEMSLQACRDLGGGTSCTIVVSYANSVGVLASSPNGAYGVAYHGIDDFAVDAALKNCRESGGKDCRVRAVVSAQGGSRDRFLGHNREEFDSHRARVFGIGR